MSHSHLLHTSFVPTAPPSLRRRAGCAIPLPRRAHVIQSKIREIFMPALSSTMTEGKIVSWVKSEGDKLAKGESVVVVESDKADMDVESFYDGYLAAIIVDEGLSAAVGSTIALLAETEEEIALAKSKKTSSPGGASPAVAEENNAPTELEEMPSPAPAPIAAATPSAKTSLPAGPALGSAVHPASDGGKRVVASPYAKKLAKDLGVDLRGIVGSGPNGRVVAKDVEAAAMAAAAASGGGATTAAEIALRDIVTPSGVELGSVVPFTTMQNAVSRNMVESLAVPTFRVGYTITTDALDALYKKIKSKGVTMTALLAKATALALVQHPVVNSSCRDGKSFTYNSHINIAVAVAIDGGLITPVLQDADKIDLYSLSRKWKELVDKARAKQLQPQEYTTGTFTLSNLGMFGVDRFDAILPPGTGAIMAVGASQPTLVGTKDGRIGLKTQMQVNVTADHRVIYGADLAAFLQTLAKIIEDPKDLTL
ncbi:dihydrolipoyllysine-residue acetyltransferase component 5 of pyruvate dehydrogenase complex, chloroplastic [Andrographis paniculata]|uniref:dihydrolipoyllysine-residue acetyltransferase component 5 of pyruvate dehydrogenase complex, chloroplastic n=1 Tax=Andrographis paniculata TaxID=175694 RepID=UPI0021E7ADCA|nr:dihydrolipoyllysine-residue acetyltransferase component 5 of pyruvate dehydrogenase complex, chloroplastic [Andrographis paniculata]